MGKCLSDADVLDYLVYAELGEWQKVTHMKYILNVMDASELF